MAWLLTLGEFRTLGKRNSLGLTLDGTRGQKDEGRSSRLMVAVTGSEIARSTLPLGTRLVFVTMGSVSAASPAMTGLVTAVPIFSPPSSSGVRTELAVGDAVDAAPARTLAWQPAGPATETGLEYSVPAPSLADAGVASSAPQAAAWPRGPWAALHAACVAGVSTPAERA